MLIDLGCSSSFFLFSFWKRNKIVCGSPFRLFASNGIHYLSLIFAMVSTYLSARKPNTTTPFLFGYPISSSKLTIHLLWKNYRCKCDTLVVLLLELCLVRRNHMNCWKGRNTYSSNKYNNNGVFFVKMNVWFLCFIQINPFVCPCQLRFMLLLLLFFLHLLTFLI